MDRASIALCPTILAVIILLTAVAFPLYAEEMGQKVLSAVITFDIPIINGISQKNSLERNISDAITKPAASKTSMSDVIENFGGKWRIIKSANNIQIAFFLPLENRIACEILTVIIRHLTVCLRNWNPAAESDDPLFDRLHAYVKHMNSSSGTHRPVSLWMNQEADRFQCDIQPLIDDLDYKFREIPKISAGEKAGHLVIPKHSTSVAFLCSWNEVSMNALYSAEYMAQSFARSQKLLLGNLSFEIWTEPSKILLAIIANPQLHDIAKIEDEMNGILSEGSSDISLLEWNRFVSMCRSITDSELRDLEKGAFLSAWGKHYAFQEMLPETPVFSFPTETVKFISMPDAIDHEILADIDRIPYLSAMCIPNSPESGLNMSVAVSFNSAKRDGFERIFYSNLVGEFPGIFFERFGNEHFVIYHHVPDNYAGSFLTNIRAILNLSLSQASVAEINTQAEITAVATVGNVPAYRTICELRQWKMPNVGAVSESVNLSRDLINTILGLQASTPELMKGRWTLATSTLKGIACILAKMMTINLNPRDFRKIPSLF